jgi:hypothetical protein
MLLVSPASNCVDASFLSIQKFWSFAKALTSAMVLLIEMFWGIADLRIAQR